MFRTKAIQCLLLGVAACSLEADPGEPTFTGVEVVEQGNGVFRLQVDASEEDAWIYFSLASASGVESPVDPKNSRTWDLGFRRFLVKSNGGVSGSGNVSVAAVPGASFEDLKVAPASGYVQDVAGAEPDPNAPDEVLQPEVDYAFNVEHAESPNGWYNYDPTSHTLSPAAVVYVVKALDERFYKVEFVRYYNDAGSPAILTLRFAEIPPATGNRVDASTGWTYLSISEGVMNVPDPEVSLAWDFAINRTRMRTNGGTSGSGRGGGAWAPEGILFEQLSEVTTVGFHVDEELKIAFPMNAGTESGNPILGDWYNYNSTTHQVSPKKRVLVLRGADGASYGKLQIISYEDGIFDVRLGSVKAVAKPVQRTVTAATEGSWVGVNLRTGVVGTSTSTSDLTWDIAVSRTNIRTNSGTSGNGEAGAVELSNTDLSDVSTAPPGGYEVDEMLPVPGSPGSGEFSGNPVLNGWFDYDDVNHTVSPRDVIYVVRTANGDFAKLKVLAYDEGVLTLSFAYAGPVRNTF